MRRFASGSPLATASSRAASSSRSAGLQGFVFYAAEQLARRPGRVLVEAPSYDRPLKILAREGAEIVALEMDDEGLDPEALEAELRGRDDPPSFLYTIPTFQNPSGRTLSAERRARLIEIVREHGLAVLEDDPYGLVRFEGDIARRASSSSKAGSWSRTRRPSRRRSRRACEPATSCFRLPTQRPSRSAPSRRTSRRRSSRRPSWPSSSHAVTSSRTSSAFAVSCSRAATRCSRALAAHAPSGSSWSHPQGGYFVWLDLDGADTTSLAADAEREGVTFVAGKELLPRGLTERRDERAPRVQLRDSGAHHRGRAAPDAAPRLTLTPAACGDREAARTGSRPRSRCRRTGG